jgi:hypothetical protein
LPRERWLLERLLLLLALVRRELLFRELVARALRALVWVPRAFVRRLLRAFVRLLAADLVPRALVRLVPRALVREPALRPRAAVLRFAVVLRPCAVVRRAVMRRDVLRAEVLRAARLRPVLRFALELRDAVRERPELAVVRAVRLEPVPWEPLRDFEVERLREAEAERDFPELLRAVELLRELLADFRPLRDELARPRELLARPLLR